MSNITDIHASGGGILQAFLSDERFWPTEPNSLQQTGLSDTLIESLICKQLAVSGTASGRNIAEQICLPFRLLEEVFGTLRTRQILVHGGSAPFNDYYYSLTEEGRQRAENYRRSCAYVGPAPVHLADYVNSVEAQSLQGDEAPTDVDLVEACRDISVSNDLLNMIGPAVSSGAGLFLYGAPGNGKSTIAQRVTRCFGTDMWIPYAIIEDGQIIKFFDAAFHQPVEEKRNEYLKDNDHDCRWLRVRRPTVVVGGELVMDNLELLHDPTSNVSESPLQLKSNGGCLLIDDFGRQRVSPAEMLNRWIVPLEAGHDFLTLPTGKKIQVPFEQLIIFSTNIEPRDLVDEAFLRRIPYKVEIADPDEREYRELFKLAADHMGLDHCDTAVEHMFETHYRPTGRPMRRCHPRDLLLQVRNHCRYRRMPAEIKHEYLDIAARTYFSTVLEEEQGNTLSNSES